MRLSQAFGKTLREAPADAEMASHQLLIRANFVRPLGAGIYTYMPFGYRVLRKIWNILAEEMDAIVNAGHIPKPCWTIDAQKQLNKIRYFIDW